MDTRFYHFLRETNIICELSAEKGPDAIRQLSRQLALNTSGINEKEIFDAVIARENILSTVVMPGLAVPHARMENVKGILVALGTSVKGIDFNSPRMPPVNVVIMILTPKSDPSLHFQILYALAKDFKKPETTQSILGLKTPKEILKFFLELD